jgi:hypothetical protein
MTVDARILKAYGIALRNTHIVSQAYEQFKGIAILPMVGNNFMILDLDALPREPIPFKEVIIRWLLECNEGRIRSGQEPIFTYALVLSCPLWKVIKPPLRPIGAHKSAVINNGSAVKNKLNSGPSISSINNAIRALK